LKLCSDNATLGTLADLTLLALSKGAGFAIFMQAVTQE
jgi:hypothetical protein